MNEYKLVNPYILGKMKTSCKTKTAEDAAEKIWNRLSKYTNNNVPKFYFSLKQKGGDLYHFMVKEKISKGKNVDYNIEKIDIKSGGHVKKIYNHIKKIKELMNEKKQTAGRHHRYREDDSSSSSSSSSEYLTSTNKLLLHKILKRARHENEMVISPIDYVWYNPIIYAKPDVFIPTFIDVVPHYLNVWGFM